MPIKTIKVSELGLILEEYIDSIELNYFWIEGEIQNYRGANKHYYFSLFIALLGVMIFSNYFNCYKFLIINNRQ